MTSRSAPGRRWSWRSRAFRGVVFQVLALAAVVAAASFLVSNTLENMRVRGIQSGFDFLVQPAGFHIGETLIAFESSHSYAKAFANGLINTLRVAIVGILATTVIGVLIGIGRVSRNFVVRVACAGYVEAFRNIPVLLQLLMWYFTITEFLPAVNDALNLAPGVWLSKSGLQFPVPVWALGHLTAFAGFVLGVAASVLWARRGRRLFEATGVPRSVLGPSVAFIGGLTVLGWALGGAPVALDVPEKSFLNFSGGGAVTPEFLAMLIGLTLYTAAFVAETVRAGIQAVVHGQVEAAASLGLTRGMALRLVVLPQALRVIIPPTTNQYLNLTKNSSLAVAVGYPDLVSISNTALNQTGRAVECIAIIMAVYLALSLATSAVMNWYNARAAIKER